VRLGIAGLASNSRRSMSDRTCCTESACRQTRQDLLGDLDVRDSRSDETWEVQLACAVDALQYLPEEEQDCGLPDMENLKAESAVEAGNLAYSGEFEAAWPELDEIEPENEVPFQRIGSCIHHDRGHYQG
jgi:hypothetical protein